MKHRKGSWDPTAPALASAQRELPLFAAEYFASGRKAAKKRVTPEDLHEFRLSTKHFRYLLELFSPVYGEGMNMLLEQLRAVQTLLGDLNDYAVTESMVRPKNSRDSAETALLLDFLAQQNKKKRSEFRKYWKESFDSDGAEARWIAYLARGTAPRKTTSRLGSKVSANVRPSKVSQ